MVQAFTVKQGLISKQHYYRTKFLTFLHYVIHFRLHNFLQPAEPVTYIRQDSITYVGEDIDHMGEDEYEHDRVADDIKTNAIEISATKRAQDNQGVCMLCI